MLKSLILMLSLLLIPACSESVPVAINDIETGRWYSEAQVAMGALVFQQNCAQCHGEYAQGLAGDWRERLEDGSFPPPPLDGTAHAWHHSRSVLIQVINNGGTEYGGKMPGFAEVLDEEQKLAAIAFFQSYWTDEIYAQWMQMGGTD